MCKWVVDDSLWCFLHRLLLNKVKLGIDLFRLIREEQKKKVEISICFFTKAHLLGNFGRTVTVFSFQCPAFFQFTDLHLASPTN